MADFVREFDVRHQIKLEQNYRSYSNILDSANHPSATTAAAWAKTCAPTRARRAGARVRSHQRPGEAQWMVDESSNWCGTATA